MPNLFLHWLTLSSGCGYFGSVWLRSPNSLNYPTPVSYGYNKSKFNTCFCFHTRLTLLSSLVCLGYGFSNAKAQRFGVLGTHLCPELRSLSQVWLNSLARGTDYVLCAKLHACFTCMLL